VAVAQAVADLVDKGGQQVHAASFPLVAGRGELGVVAGRRVGEPAPAVGVVVEPDRVAGRLARIRPLSGATWISSDCRSETSTPAARYRRIASARSGAASATVSDVDRERLPQM
jgi:hypothetical protein